eukprot:TRINITY_DN4438_c0_g1_i1.p1 TRINITY_DN4438_c0_g1~~TRINITY_DN4438_c0_g1_i1.p1  ORF type:complete len:371 (-),score=64.17 TRINITY_DN4438_c0_g1_i1:80-1192(-)
MENNSNNSNINNGSGSDGNTAHKAKTVSSSSNYLADIVGEESLRGHRTQAGIILDMIDCCAGRVAWAHSEGPVATVSFDRVDFLHPVLHLDLVRLEGRALVVGASSMVIEVQGYRRTPNSATRSFTPLVTCYVTMVAIGNDGKPRKNIPQLIYETDEEKAARDKVLKRRELTQEWSKIMDGIEKSEVPLKVSDVEDPLNKGKLEYYDIPFSEVRVKRQFLPKHLNVNNTIFGGEILIQLEKVATHTARQFTRSFGLITLCMNRISFKKPVRIGDLLEIVAHVVYVRTHIIEIEVNLNIEHPDGTKEPSHSGYFTLLNVNEVGFKEPISVGLKLDENDQVSLKKYLMAKHRFNFKREHKTLSERKPQHSPK